jgi:predicted transcriptional regulator
MKNVTLSIDEHVLDEVRQIAARQRTTVNAMVREYLTRLASEESRIAEARQGLRELMKQSTARLGPDYVWNREDAYEGRLLPRHEHPDLRGRRKKRPA